METSTTTQFEQHDHSHLKQLKLNGLQPKTIEAYSSSGTASGEGLRLQVGDIDALRGRVPIRDAKGNRDRFVPLPQTSHPLLQRFWQVHRNPVLLLPSRHCLMAARTDSSTAAPLATRRAKLFPKDIFALPQNPRAGAGLVQPTVQIVASLRSHDLTLFVIPIPNHCSSNLPSFPRRRESKVARRKLDSRLRGNDGAFIDLLLWKSN